MPFSEPIYIVAELEALLVNESYRLTLGAAGLSLIALMVPLTWT